MNHPIKDTYAKKQIRTALLDLLTTHELSAISIDKITTTAKVSRVSFYRHYRTKEDIIREHMQLLFDDWYQAYAKTQSTSEDELLGSLFGHIREQRDFYLVLAQRNLFYLVKDILRGITGPKPEYPNFGAYVAAFITYGIYGWIEEWFARGMQESTEEMTLLLKQRHGVHESRADS